MIHIIPQAFLNLVNCPRVASFSTVMPDGQSQTTVVWCDFDGTFKRVNTMRGFSKEKNMRLNSKVTLLCFDPRQPLRYIEIRGTVGEMTESGALEHLDGLSELYIGKSPYFGECVSAELKQTEIPLVLPKSVDDLGPQKITAKASVLCPKSVIKVAR